MVYVVIELWYVKYTTYNNNNKVQENTESINL